MQLLNYNEFIEQINECVALGVTVENQQILAKNRDRNYNPTIEIIHKIRNGVEMAYMRDTVTDWCEGINEYGIALVNTTLKVYYDEKAGNTIFQDIDKDGQTIRRILSKTSIKDCIDTIIKDKLYGHTILMDKTVCYHIEYTSRNKPSINLINTKKEPIITTNHGINYDMEGYSAPDQDINKKISSELRLKNAAIKLIDAETPNDIPKLLRDDMYDSGSNYNTYRKTDNMITTSQIMLNCTNNELNFYYEKTKTEKYLGIKNLLPNNYIPKITINVQQINENEDNIGTYNVFMYGSNMDKDRLDKRFKYKFVPTEKERKFGIDPNNIKSYDIACLTKYKLMFNKIGIDGTAKANIKFTGDDNDCVWGVIYKMNNKQITELDKHEIGYNKQTIQLDSKNHNNCNALVYIADPEFIDNNLPILQKYYDYCLNGAIKNKIDKNYINDNIKIYNNRIK